MTKKSIVRSESAGVFLGEVISHDPATGTVEMRSVRRLWKWAGAASISQLAVDGVSKPNECKFPVEVNNMIIAKVIEIVACTPKAQRSLEEVPIWSE